MDKQKILLIEDDRFIREIYTFTLQKANYKVLTAVDGQEGVALAKNNPDANLILLDVIMPNMNGVEVLQLLKAGAATQNIPVILLSNLTDEKLIDEAMKHGAYGYLVKAQIVPTQLVEKVKEMIKFHGKNKS